LLDGERATNRRILYVAAFVRAFATGTIGVLLAAYLAERGFDAEAASAIVAAGLSGNALALLVTTWIGDRVDARRALVVLSALWTIGAVVVAFAHTTLALAAAAFVGMLNGMGRDRGAALAIEQATLPSTTPDADRTRAFAWYNALQDAGHALGALAAGVPAWLASAHVATQASAQHGALLAYAAIGVVCIALYARLSPFAPHALARAPLTSGTRRVLAKICALFALDSLGGGFLTAALVSYFFFERFGVGVSDIALLFFGARVANVLSHFAAAWLARRIGLVNTMVFTHVPSSLLLVTVAIAPSFPVAAALFLLREGLVEMDVPTRQSYVMALVLPEERARASSVTNLVRMAAWPVSAFAGGLLMTRASLVAPLVVGAAMKIAYDVLLYRAFRRLEPPEERAR
jgi:MFS family permease